MATLEEMFFREFNQMMNQRHAANPMFSIQNLDVPKGALGEINKFDMVYVKGITEEYYSKLNNTEAYLWSGGKLSRRKYDHTGKYIMKDGKYDIQEVTLPHECVAIISDENISVPVRFKPKESFEYVDCVQRTNPDGTKTVKRVYIVPREYCYKMAQTALVISLTKLKSYYLGGSYSFQHGYVVYIYVIPYKPRSNISRSYRILATKTDIDYTEEINSLVAYWNQRGYLFNKEDCTLYEGIKGRDNLAYEYFPPTVEAYERYKPDLSMAKQDLNDMSWDDNFDSDDFTEE